MPNQPPLIESVSNLRDLGGLTTSSGRTIATGRLYRSSNFSELAPSDEAALAALGLHTIVDLRGVNERANAPSRGIRDGMVDLHFPIEPSALGSMRALREAGTVDDAAMIGVMHGAYRRFVEDQAGVFGALLHRLLDASAYPLVFHCTAGKDRTGFAAALVLSALDVPEPSIVADFLQSNGRWVAHGASSEWTVLAQVRAEYLLSAFAVIRERWGSVDGYLASALNFGASERVRLGELLLVPSPSL